MKKFLMMIILLSTLVGCGNPSAAVEKMPVSDPLTISSEITATSWSETEEIAFTFSDELSKTEKTEIKVASTESKEGYAATDKTDSTVSIQSTLQTEDQTKKESKTEDEHPETELTKEETAISTIPETIGPKPSDTPDCESKSIFDYEFDVSAIQRELISIGLGMG